MGEKVYQWTNTTKQGFINDELDALWAAINAVVSDVAGLDEDEFPTFTTSSAHGFAVGDFLGVDSSGEWTKAGGGTGVQAVVRVITVPTSTTFTAAGPGLHTVTNTEQVGAHWLSPTTAGGTQTTGPSVLAHQLVMVVISSSHIVLFPTELLA